MMIIRFAIVVALLGTAPLVAAPPASETGEVKFTTEDAKAGVPELFRLESCTFRYTLTPKYDLVNSGVEILSLTFPSSVKSAHASNDIVYATYFRPKSPGKKPAVIILDILDGKQVVAEAQALWLAQHDVAALVVVMTYYGPRRPAGSKERMLTTDVEKSVANVRQTVLDCRRATAWLASRPDVESGKLSILGTSLGSFVSGVVAGAEPRIRSACLLLGGGGLVDSFSEHPLAGGVLSALALVGVTKQQLKKLIDPIDPITYAERLKNKRLLLIAASKDDVVPPIAMKRLWEATGKPELIWVEATHVGAAGFTFQMMRAVTKHVKE